MSVNISDCTVTEKILLASHQLEQDGQSPFSAEALIVACWQKFPKTFGLKGFADQYPDSNKVLSSIMGERGLARRGWLVKMGQKLYALTREGRTVSQRLLTGGEPIPRPAPASPRSKISSNHEQLLLRLLESPALEKIDEGRKPELTFTDACRFWDISENLNGNAVDERMDQLRNQLTELNRLLNKGDIDLSTGRSVSSEEIHHLVDAHEYLEERFARHLSLLRTRA